LFTLDREERQRVVRIVPEETGRRSPVLAGVVDVTTAGAVRTARDAAQLGADGLFVSPPIGAGDITQSWDAEAYPEVLIDLLHAIAAEVDLPIVVHPVGKTTAAYGVGLSAAAVRRVCEEVPQVVGWKMTYNYDGYRAVTRTLRELDRPVAILGAVAKYFHENLASDAFDGSAQAFGGVDVVVNGAGIMLQSAIADLDLDDLDRVYRTNIRGTFAVSQQAARRLRSAGAIINFSSTLTRRSMPASGAYTTSKAAVEAMTLNLARELSGRDITVNAIAPGPIATAMFHDGRDEQAIAQAAAGCPLGRLGVPPT
jgi:NAD(P)-dependent dehydrogenase (short-subunit alcohol dehydrogenase family)